MEEVEDGILLARSLVAGWGIDGETTLHAERGAVVPALANGAVGYVVDREEVALVACLAGDDEVVGERLDVTIDKDVLQVELLLTIDHEVVAVVVGFEGFGCGVFPHAVLAFLEVGRHADSPFALRGVDELLGQEVATDLDAHGLGGIEAEGDGVVGVNLGRHDVAAAEQGLLCLGAQGGEDHGREG